jgi:DNA-binding response OmpR family regulator
MSETETLTATRIPTVYFIDDSATMREVIKIAFRKENIQVITCPDAASALAQFADAAPDAVITDVIMPDKDGYEVCQLIKQDEQLARIPVILMSGVVNRAVAEKATAVKADELIRKPFQPRELIACVKSLLRPKFAGLAAEASSMDEAPRRSSETWSGLFSPGPAPAAPANVAAPRASMAPIAAATARPAPPQQRRAAPTAGPTAVEVQKLRNEIVRLQLLVKKLQAELEAERQYCAALETHLKNPPGLE